MNKFKVLLTHPLPSDWLTSISHEVEWVIGPDNCMGISPQVLTSLPEVDGILCFLCDRISEDHINKATKLKVVSNYAAGTDNIDLVACSQRGIPVGNTPGALTDATADLTLALMLSLIRQLPQAAQAARLGDWKMWYASRWLGEGLRGANLGIVGMGIIGSEVARRARGFGMNILYTSRTPKPEIEGELSARYVDFRHLLTESDIVTLHAPLTPATHHMFCEKAFKLMKQTSYFINTSRGAEVDTSALVRALREGWITAAGLDVADPEPLPPDHPLYSLPNCLILPHIGSATVSARRKMAEMACENLIVGLRGGKLPHCANPEYVKK